MNKKQPLGLIGILMTCFFLGCGSEYPETLLTGKVTGKIFYEGEQLGKLSNSALGVYAMTSLNFDSFPNGSRLYLKPNIPESGFFYQIENLAPYTYVVVSQIIDLDKTGSPTQTGVALGLMFNVEILAGETLENQDITLVDFQM